MSESLALFMLQLLALAIPPVTILIKMLRRSENISWQLRRLSFLSATSSIALFLLAIGAILVYLLGSQSLPMTLQFALGATVVGLVPFLVVTHTVYQDHKANFGP